MEIRLTEEQINEFLENGYINVYMGDYRFYMELGDEGGGLIWYLMARRYKFTNMMSANWNY